MKDRAAEMRIQALGAAISRRDWHACEAAYGAIRDDFYAVTAEAKAPDWSVIQHLDAGGYDSFARLYRGNEQAARNLVTKERDRGHRGVFMVQSHEYDRMAVHDFMGLLRLAKSAEAQLENWRDGRG